MLATVLIFFYFCVLHALVVPPQSRSEFKFVSDLLKKLGISSATMTEEEMEDVGLSKMLKSVGKTKKVSRENVMRKLRS